MDILFGRLGAITGASTDQIKLIFCLLASYPLGNLYVRLPHSQPKLKHVFSAAVSAFFLIPVLNLWFGALQLLVSALGAYTLSSMLKGRNMPWIVFAFVMGHLTLNQVYRAVNEISLETFEITGPQMVMTMKLTMFAWNVLDGRRPAEELDKWQLKHRIQTMPSLLEFLGYAFYFPGCLVGPSIDYSDYAGLIDGSLYTGHGDASGKHAPRGRKRTAYTRMAMGLVFLGLFIVLGPKFPYEIVLEDDWLHKGFFHRFTLVQIIGLVTRMKYYAIWTLTEGACILTGLGFTGFTSSGEPRWDGAANVNVPLIEWPSNPKMIFDSWNMKTNVWLRECIYKRVARPDKKPGFKSSMTTFITSAFWHGIAGGYYLAFLLGGFMTTVGRQCRRYIRPFFLPPILSQQAPEVPRTFRKRLYDYMGSATSIVLLNFIASAFVLAGFNKSLEAWRRMNWYGVWMLGCAMLFFTLGGKNWLEGLAEVRVRRAERRREEETKGVKVTRGNGINLHSSGTHAVEPVVDTDLGKLAG